MNINDFIVISIENYISSNSEFKKKYNKPIFIENSGEFKYNELSVSDIIEKRGENGYNMIFFILNSPEDL